jgi:elongation factor Ts
VQTGADRAGGDLGKAEESCASSWVRKRARRQPYYRRGRRGDHRSPDGKLGAIIEVNCETDFVAKNDEFLRLASDCAASSQRMIRLDVAALVALPMGEGTVESTRTALVGKIGENMSIRRFVRIEAKGRLASYVHGGAKIGVLVDYVGGDDQLGKDLAMHIAAAKPKALDASGIAAELIESERRIAIEKAREAGKPEAMIEKIVDGSVQKFLNEVTLLGQVFVKAEDGKQTIAQLLKAKGASVAGFTLFVVGEGLAKRSNDFAAEVAAQAAACPEVAA